MMKKVQSHSHDKASVNKLFNTTGPIKISSSKTTHGNMMNKVEDFDDDGV
jgi:hypothetical protein